METLSILIVGTGKLGRESGQQLIDAGHRLTFIDEDHLSAQKAKDIFGERVVQGDGCDPKVLERAGIARAQVIIAATGDDEDNLIISELAHRVFGVPYVLARVNRPENQWLFTPQRGVDTVICPVLLATDIIKREVDNRATKLQK